MSSNLIKTNLAKSEIFQKAKEFGITPKKGEKWNSKSYQDRAIRELEKREAIDKKTRKNIFISKKSTAIPQTPKKVTDPKAIRYQQAKKMGFFVPIDAATGKKEAWNSKLVTELVNEFLEDATKPKPKPKKRINPIKKQKNEIIKFLKTPVESEKILTIKEHVPLRELLEIFLTAEFTPENNFLIGYISSDGEEKHTSTRTEFINKVTNKLDRGIYDDLLDGVTVDKIPESDEEFVIHYSRRFFESDFIIQANPKGKNIPKVGFFDMVFTPENIEAHVYPYEKNESIYPNEKGDYLGYEIDEEISKLLERYQIYTKSKFSTKNNFENCFGFVLKTLEKDGAIPSGTYDKFIQFNSVNHCLTIKTNMMGKLSKLLNLNFILTSYREDQNKRVSTVYAKAGDTAPLIKIGMLNNHCFINEELEYSTFAVKNLKYRYMKGWKDATFISRQGGKNGAGYLSKINKQYRKATSFDLIRWMMEQPGAFEKIDYSTLQKIEEVSKYINSKLDIEGMELLPNEEISAAGTSLTGKLFKGENYDTYIIDVETYTNTKKHVPYCCVLKKLYSDDPYKSFIGEDCVQKMMNSLYYGIGNRKPILIFAHNLGYDFSFMFKCKGLQIKNIIRPSNSQVKTASGFWYSHPIIFKCSYSLTGIGLKKFATTFNLDCKKEIFPYNAYTDKSIKQRHITVKKALKHLDKKDHAEFIKNLDDLKMFTTPKKDHFDHIAYSLWYCTQDVRVLGEGLDKCRTEYKNLFNIDLFNYISIPQIAHDVGKIHGVFENVTPLVGICRDFVQKCIYGGRVMTAENKKIHTAGDNVQIQDFDAVSLYPSAMVRDDMIIPAGNPEIIKKSDERRSIKSLSEYVAYYVKVEFTGCNKSRKFPLFSKESADGVKNYTNDCKGIHYLAKPQLEDILRFHEVNSLDYNIIEGYGYKSIANDNLKKFINYLFNQRLIYKDKSNPEYNNVKQEIMKLLMNSFYGKTIQKPHMDEDIIIYDKKKSDEFISRHYSNILEINECQKDGEFHHSIIKKSKNIFSYASYPHIGANILAISKRIMNEVMTLAEDLNINIYYQDTDSMHIDESGIKPLSEEYFKTYNRELIGKQLGQFHSDFDFGSEYNTKHSVAFIGLGKKCYIDKVLCDDIKNKVPCYKYHIRMKGVPNAAILEKCEFFNLTELEIYENLYNDTAHEIEYIDKKKGLYKLGYNFNILAGGKCSFETTKNFDISSRKEMFRFISFQSKPSTESAESF